MKLGVTALPYSGSINLSLKFRPSVASLPCRDLALNQAHTVA
jgi:hypothetical protein